MPKKSKKEEYQISIKFPDDNVCRATNILKATHRMSLREFYEYLLTNTFPDWKKL